MIQRASTGNQFWLYNLEGASFDPQRVTLLRSLLVDYTKTTPEVMQFLAGRYLVQRAPLRLAVIPEGQKLAELPPSHRGARGAQGR
jgi:zinc protease